MKTENVLTVPLQEKVYVTEVYQNRNEDLVAVGLRGSVAIVCLSFEDPKGPAKYEIIQSINHDSRVQCLAWSPETTLAVAPRFIKFAAGGSDHNVRLFATDLGDNESMRVLKGHRDYVNALTFHPEDDGGQVVSGSDDHTLCLWDSNSGQHLHTVTFDSPVMATVWHPEEVSKLMIAEKNGVIHIFNIVSYHPIMSLDCVAKPLLSADWSLSNSLLISAAVRSDVIVFDLSKMAQIAKKFTRQDTIKSVKMAPFSDALIATAGQPNYSIKLSNIKNNHVVPVLLNEPVAGLSWHPQKNILVVGHDENISVYRMLNKPS